jgi:hypothetical protein
VPKPPAFNLKPIEGVPVAACPKIFVEGVVEGKVVPKARDDVGAPLKTEVY